jgi:hypothetical protein
MNNSFIYLTVLAAMMLIASYMTALAQDDSRIILNNTTSANISSNNLSSDNISFDISAMDLSTNANLDSDVQPVNVRSNNNSIFIITGYPIVMPSDRAENEILSLSSAIQPLKRTIFIIDFVRPGSSISYENRSLLNGAYLSRKVEGTPHGYVTYYN